MNPVISTAQTEILNAGTRASPLTRAAIFSTRFGIKPLLSLALFLLGIYGYAHLSARSGAFHAEMFFLQWIELGLVSYLYVYLYLIQKPGPWRVIAAALPILLAYLAQDLYFHFYGKVLRIIEVMELPELFAVLPLSYGLILAAVFFAPLAAYLYTVNYRQPRRILLGALPLLTLVLLVKTTPQAYADFVESIGNEIIRYSDGKSVESNGRITMLLYHEAQRVKALAETAPYRNRAAYEQEGDTFAAQLKANASNRNVHLIVLESFLDPTLFHDATFSRDPVHPEFKQLFGGKLGLSIGPVFGGATAQAEFEVLCGVPAFEKLSSVEFNIFTGSAVNCTPGILQRLGYRTVATNAYKPNFFNAQPAYKGIGFQETYFPREFTGSNPTYLEAGDVSGEDYLFDGELFKQNLAFVEQHLKEHPGQPLLNYIMTIYGHTPHLLNDSKRPPVVQISAAHQDEHLLMAANQFYYRTQAIAQFVKQLRAMDPQSLVILVADHVPPLIYGPITYRELGYLGNIENSYYHNRLMIVENGTPKTYNTIHHYGIPDIVYDYLTAGHYCRNNGCAHTDTRIAQDKAQYLPQYFHLMAHASQ
ncbi:MAG TPA: sulfatase-like hydrolase/transferase [Gammaproteobacteria bacterium]